MPSPQKVVHNAIAVLFVCFASVAPAPLCSRFDNAALGSTGQTAAVLGGLPHKSRDGRVDG